MAQLAILGHKTRGKEVIEILEMLGGKNSFYYDGAFKELIYTIGSELELDVFNINSPNVKNDYIVFTLKEFLEKFPYKIGDKVTHSDYESPLEIVGMKWKDDSIEYEVYTNDYGYWFIVDELQPYKEETMEETIIDTIKESKDRYRLSINYQYEIEVDEGEYYVVRRKPQYPKTYEECCEIIDYHLEGATIIGYEKPLLENLQQLLVCRNAYWKRAGEQMGLGKPWEPDWTKDTEKYVIYPYQYLYSIDVENYRNTLLAFPTKEMRDAFYENFKDLIEDCKKLL